MEKNYETYEPAEDSESYNARASHLEGGAHWRYDTDGTVEY